MIKDFNKIREALTSYNITDVEEIIYNPSYEELFEAEMDPSLTGYDKGVLTELGAVNVMTGIYTGRSPKDKYFVMDVFLLLSLSEQHQTQRQHCLLLRLVLQS